MTQSQNTSEETMENKNQASQESSQSHTNQEQNSSDNSSEKKSETSENTEEANQIGFDSDEPDAKPTVGLVDADKYKELNEKHLRLYAEFENFRKRSARESLDIIQTAGAKIMGALLPTLENLDRAFDPQKKATKLEDFEAGIKMIYKSLKETLEEEGLEEINPEGEEFDPNLHEALMQQPHATLEEGKVIQVFQKGYKVKNKILRHAKVIISTGQAG